MKTLTLLSFQFYKMLLLFNIACSLLAVMVFWYGFGHIDAYILFISKIFGFAGAVMLHQYTAKETYYYFRNAGCRMRQIMATAFTVDALIYIGLFLIFNLVTHAAAYLKS